ncbi:MAG: glycosyltransferase family 39 protein [Azoarcus sp.]|nr:glycosyltransferase family 39 protein [Azoarcus sp.]
MRVFGSGVALACYALLAAAYAGGAVVPLMNNDSAHHAAIALHIHETGNWSHLVTQGKDYLDKPHLLFWLAALSFKFFGVNALAYKLPSLLFSILAVHATVRLGTMLHSETSGRLAGVILASAFAFMLANNDVRMDAILTGAIIFSTWQLVAFAGRGSSGGRQPLTLAALGLALGFATKGMIGAVMPLIAVFLYLVYLRDWRRLFDPGWLRLALRALLFISPVLVAYFRQFGVDGVKFILWSQNIERLAGERFGNAGADDPLFFYHTFLWAFLPWSPLALWSLASSLRRLTHDRFWPRARGEALTLGTIVTMFCIMSVSQFKLPHYLNILLPFFAIHLAGWLPARLVHPGGRRMVLWVQIAVLAALVAVAFLVNAWMFPLRDGRIAVAAVALLLSGVVLARHAPCAARPVIASVCGVAVFWLLLNFNFYPRLLAYQAGSTLGVKAMTLGLAPDSLYFLAGGGRAASFDIATGRLTPEIGLEELERIDAPVVLYADATDREMIEAAKLLFDVLEYSPDYRVTRLRMRFLDPNTRARTLRPVYLLRIRPRVTTADGDAP